MSVRKLKPTTPGQRHKIVNGNDMVTVSNQPEKSLLAGKKKTGGRNNTGKMTMRQIGGGHKQRYRVIDFKRDKFGIPATVKTIEYDPNRSAFIGASGVCRRRKEVYSRSGRTSGWTDSCFRPGRGS